jgi:hypothetical protein
MGSEAHTSMLSLERDRTLFGPLRDASFVPRWQSPNQWLFVAVDPVAEVQLKSYLVFPIRK